MDEHGAFGRMSVVDWARSAPSWWRLGVVRLGPVCGVFAAGLATR